MNTATNTAIAAPVAAPEATGFSDLPLSDEVRRALDEIGYTSPTPVQAATYPLAVEGRDIIVQARTGTGKTAAFGIPLVDRLVSREPVVQALVLAPTRELALQSQREIARIGQHRGLHTVAVYGGAPMGKQVDELRSGAQIVSGTPGRVLDHLKRGTLDPSGLRVLILDEMDEMLSMGFARELGAILDFIPDRTKRQTMCFSATVDGEVRRHAERHMNNPEMISLSSDAVGVAQISHHVYMLPGGDRTGDLIRILEVEDPESAIVFCNMRSETERVAGSLKQAGFNADWLNGDLPQKDRERIMADTRQGKLRYLVCTDVAARGIDISHLTHVINYTFPESAAVYVHRTGRTGRAGRTGCAISLVSPDELGRLYYLRLEYKISPIERNLPTQGELKTRQESDRISLLESAFDKAPNASDLAVARRLLTHPAAEEILAGLLHAMLGTRNDVDDEAAAARRSRGSTNTEPEPEQPVRSTHTARRGEHRPEPRNESRAEPRAEQRSEPRGEARADNRGPRAGGESRIEPRRGDDRPSGRDRPERNDRGPERNDRHPNDRGPRAGERRQRGELIGGAGGNAAAGTAPYSQDVQPASEAGPASFAPTTARTGDAAPATEQHDDDSAAGHENADARMSGILYLNLGKRDGLRVGEVVRLLREDCALDSAEIGRIRVRDRYTFVDVPEERLPAIIEKLTGHSLHDKNLAPERAKATRSAT